MFRRWTLLAVSICLAGCGGSNGALLYGGAGNSGGASGATHGSGGSISGGGGAGGSGASNEGSGGDGATLSSSGGGDGSEAGLGDAGGDVGTASGGQDGGANRDAGNATAGATPMAISCGTSTCTITTGLTDVCCALPLSFPPFPTGCFPSFPGCVTTGVPFACDDAADCASGNICCGSTSGTGCSKACSTGSVQFCRTNGECNRGTCRPWSTAKEYSTCQ